MVSEAQNNNRLAESNEWYENLVSYREKLNELKNELYYFTPENSDTSVKKQIDHFHNQFHIQLVNIHDLKHRIKRHRIDLERPEGHYSPAAHREIEDQIKIETNIIDELEAEFRTMIKENN
jgi:hypothetical protein